MNNVLKVFFSVSEWELTTTTLLPTNHSVTMKTKEKEEYKKNI
jgi:hypothetical protein